MATLAPDNVSETRANGFPRPTASGLRARLKMLHVTTLSQASDRLVEAFAVDTATEVDLQQAIGATAGAARLREEPFDAVLITHEPAKLDALETVEGLRAGGCEEAILILGNQPTQCLEAFCYEAGADAYCLAAETTVRGLLWKFSRAIEQRELRRENRQFRQTERKRLQQEQQESQRLLEQQRELLVDLEELATGIPAASPQEVIGDSLTKTAIGEVDRNLDLPESLVSRYRELLRRHVISGPRSLNGELTELADLLMRGNASARRAMQLHVTVLEELVEGLAARSARHVMNRADLLALETLGHLADGYRQRYHGALHPPRQQGLPGFETAPRAA